MESDMMYGLNMLNNALTNATNVYLTSKSKKQDRKFAREMYEKQVADNRENWRLMNEYSSPAAQMERLREAQLNPNLIYGSGGVTGSTSLPSSGSVSSSYSTPPQVKDLQVMEQYLSVRNYERQLALTDAQIDKTRAEADNVAAQTAYTNSQTVGQELSNYVAGMVKDYKVSQEAYKSWRMNFDNDIAAATALDIAKATISKLVSEVSVLAAQKNLSNANIAALYKDIEVKNATISEIVARTQVDYATAENIYDQITSRSINDELDIQKFLINPYGTSELGQVRSVGERVGDYLDGSSWSSPVRQLGSAYDRLMQRQNSRRTTTYSSTPTRQRGYKKYKR